MQMTTPANTPAPGSPEDTTDPFRSVKGALSFFASCIRSGESWDDTCQRAYDRAMSVLDATSVPRPQEAGEPTEDEATEASERIARAIEWAHRECETTAEAIRKFRISTYDLKAVLTSRLSALRSARASQRDAEGDTARLDWLESVYLGGDELFIDRCELEPDGGGPSFVGFTIYRGKKDEGGEFVSGEESLRQAFDAARSASVRKGTSPITSEDPTHG